MSFDFEKFMMYPYYLIDVQLLLKMISESDIEHWIDSNFPKDNDEYTHDHVPGSRIFTIRKEPSVEEQLKNCT